MDETIDIARKHEQEYREEVLAMLGGLCKNDPTLLIRIGMRLISEFGNKKLHDPELAERQHKMMIPPLSPPYNTMLESFFQSYNGWRMAWENLKSL